MQLKVEETGELFSDRLKVFTLELPNYRKMKEEDCKTRIDYWLYNITNLETMKTNIPFQQQQPVFEKVGNIAELVRMTPEELKQYHISIDTYRTNLAVMQNERAEGREEGRAEGREEGRAEGLAQGLEKLKAATLNIAKQLIPTGMPAEQIAAITSLPLETIIELNREKND